jgi:hypothetical protein
LPAPKENSEEKPLVIYSGLLVKVKKKPATNAAGKRSKAMKKSYREYSHDSICCQQETAKKAGSWKVCRQNSEMKFETQEYIYRAIAEKQ